MRKTLRLLWAILLITVTGMAYSQDATSVNARPKVGLVLSGGGAKGAAHIGVLKYIEDMGIPIDYIAGTSMGSIVGGMYALGYSSDEILSIISDVDWDKLISNQVDRRRISYTRKAESRTQLVTIPFAFGTDAQELKSRSFKNSLPSGIVSGDNLINLFNSLTVGYSDPVDFNDLPIPFLCIATNVINGKADALNKGVFSKSLRASMAIPILFDPVKIDNTLYADGGLLNNFPAEQCRAMGADYVIGVSMSPGLESNPDNLSSLFSQVKQLKEFVANPNKRGGGPHNYGIAVDVTLVDCTGHPLPMGSEYDYFGDRARVDIESELFKKGEITYRELKNRQLLREIMTEAGWLTIPSEWWHFNAMPLRVASQKLTVIQ